MRVGTNVTGLIGEMNRNFEGCTQKLKAGGLDYFEIMSDWGADPKTLAFYKNLTGCDSGWDNDSLEKRISYFRANGMDVWGMFVFDEILESQAEELGKFCQKNQISYVVISFLEYKNGIESVYEDIKMLRHIIDILAQYHVQVWIHNHEHDLTILADKDGREKSIMDIFLENFSAEELMLEADTGWLVYAGVDAVEFVGKHSDRIAALHFKDIHKDYKNMDRQDIFVACGEGTVDFQAVLKAVPAVDSERILYILDQDASKGDMIKDQIDSVKYIKDLGASVWKNA